MSKKRDLLIISALIFLVICILIVLYFMYRNAPDTAVDNGASVYLEKKYLDYEYGKYADEFLPEVRELGNYKSVDFEIVDPSFYVKRKTKFERAFCLYVEYSEEDYKERLNRVQIEKHLLLYTEAYADYNGYIAVKDTKLKSHIALVIDEPQKNRISYVYVACPQMEVINVQDSIIRYPLWDVEEEYIIGADWEYRGVNEQYYEDIDNYSSYIEAVRGADEYFPSVDELGNYNKISVILKHLDVTYYSKSVSVFVEYDKDEYLRVKEQLLLVTQLLDEEKSQEYHIYDIYANVTGADIYVVDIGEKGHYDLYAIGFDDENNVVSYMLVCEGRGWIKCPVENLDALVKHDFYIERTGDG